MQTRNLKPAALMLARVNQHPPSILIVVLEDTKRSLGGLDNKGELAALLDDAELLAGVPCIVADDQTVMAVVGNGQSLAGLFGRDYAIKGVGERDKVLRDFLGDEVSEPLHRSIDLFMQNIFISLLIILELYPV